MSYFLLRVRFEDSANRSGKSAGLAHMLYIQNGIVNGSCAVMFSRYLQENRRVYRGAKLASTSLALGARLLINEASTMLSAEVESRLQRSTRLLWTLSF